MKLTRHYGPVLLNKVHVYVTHQVTNKDAVGKFLLTSSSQVSEYVQFILVGTQRAEVARETLE